MDQATPGKRIFHRVAELLKLFNSRTCQLVLGAGAMQVSGLKSITAKHLALANQSVTLVIALLPDIKTILGAMLQARRPPPQRPRGVGRLLPP